MEVVWLMNVILIVVIVLFIAILKRLLSTARSIPPTIDAIAAVAQAASRDLDAVVVLLTTQDYISQIVGSVENYGGSLNAALPDY